MIADCVTTCTCRHRSTGAQEQHDRGRWLPCWLHVLVPGPNQEVMRQKHQQYHQVKVPSKTHSCHTQSYMASVLPIVFSQVLRAQRWDTAGTRDGKALPHHTVAPVTAQLLCTTLTCDNFCESDPSANRNTVLHVTRGHVVATTDHMCGEVVVRALPFEQAKSTAILEGSAQSLRPLGCPEVWAPSKLGSTHACDHMLWLARGGDGMKR